MDLIEDDNHSRTIIHIDLDCFYAQVEMIKNPKLNNVPLGIQQKNLVVTTNYVARDLGVKKGISVSEALKLCPNITLVKGEDLHDYRQFSTRVHSVVQKYSSVVEKLGLDENFVDVTEQVEKQFCSNSNNNILPVGNVYGTSGENCDCGCKIRLNIGSIIASQIRKNIKEEIGLTCCAGIAHNKLLAKLIGSVHKPNQQTVIYPRCASELLFSLPSIKSIPGIGLNTYDSLKALNIKTVEDLRNCSIDQLEKTIGRDKAKQLINLSFGKDDSLVRPSGKPQTIGIEDSCRSISVETEAKNKFRLLLQRLMILVTEDGRIPRTIKLTLRKFDPVKKVSHRETRQCNISTSLFTMTNNIIKIRENAEETVLNIIMGLFYKLIDITKPYHVTLLGLAFTKFEERQQGRHSITSFLMNKISVQSTAILQNNIPSSSSGTQSTPMDQSPIHQASFYNNDTNTDGSESEVEPSPKKPKLNSFVTKHRFFNSSIDCPSPSKLRVAELRLNSREMDQSPIENFDVKCPDNIDPEVFKELPKDVQSELIQQWQLEKKIARQVIKKSKPNTLLQYLIKNK